MYPVILQFNTLQPKQSVFVLKHKNVEMQPNSQRHTTEELCEWQINHTVCFTALDDSVSHPVASNDCKDLLKLPDHSVSTRWCYKSSL